MRRRRVALVVQRFGEELVGGAEGHARAIANTLARHHDVTVLTSCARDATSWAMHYAPGTAIEGGLRVTRFAHPNRNSEGRARVPLRHKLRMHSAAVFDVLGWPRVAQISGDEVMDGHAFLRCQGPFCAELVSTLREDQAGFDAVVFVTALFYPTAEGLPAWGRRSVLVPTLHDEKAMYLPWYGKVFSTAGAVLYNTEAERTLARRLYGPQLPDGRIVGVGVPVQQVSDAAIAQLRQPRGLPDKYVVYVGRIEKGKGCGNLLQAWGRLGARRDDVGLAFVGRGSLRLDGVPGVHALGYLADDERDAVVAGSAAVVVPSRLESLSLTLLEALALGVPVVANADSAVLADHVRLSGAGVAYRGVGQLAAALRTALLRSAAERATLGEAGRKYVRSRYAPAAIEQAWLDAVESVCRA